MFNNMPAVRSAGGAAPAGFSYVGAAQRFSLQDRQAALREYDVPLPAGIQAGDMLILSRTGIGIAAGDNPAGWTQIVNLGGGEPTFRVSWKIADAGDVSSGIVVVKHGYVINEGLCAVTYAFRGAEATGPVIVAQGVSADANLGHNGGFLYLWTAQSTLANGEALFYTQAANTGSTGVGCAMAKPTTPTVPTGLSNENQAISGYIGRSVASWHDILPLAGPSSAWQGPREALRAVYYMVARILPA